MFDQGFNSNLWALAVLCVLIASCLSKLSNLIDRNKVLDLREKKIEDAQDKLYSNAIAVGGILKETMGAMGQSMASSMDDLLDLSNRNAELNVLVSHLREFTPKITDKIKLKELYESPTHTGYHISLIADDAGESVFFCNQYLTLIYNESERIAQLVDYAGTVIMKSEISESVNFDQLLRNRPMTISDAQTASK